MVWGNESYTDHLKIKSWTSYQEVCFEGYGRNLTLEFRKRNLGTVYLTCSLRKEFIPVKRSGKRIAVENSKEKTWKHEILWCVRLELDLLSQSS